MKLGFTGTQSGMNVFQKTEYLKLLDKYNPVRLNHGDCIGADSEAHFLFIEWHSLHDICEREIHIYSPTLKGKIAFCGYPERYPEAIKETVRKCKNAIRIVNHTPRAYLERNKDIVDDSNVMIAAPKEMEHTLRSGTWATVRYSWRKGKETIVIPPIYTESEK